MTVLAQPVYAAVIPKEGPKSIPVRIDFTDDTTARIDMREILQRARMEAVQSVYVDAADLEGTIVIRPAAGSPVAFAPGSQAYAPIVIADPWVVDVSVSEPGGRCHIIFLNVPMPAGVWP